MRTNNKLNVHIALGRYRNWVAYALVERRARVTTAGPSLLPITDKPLCNRHGGLFCPLCTTPLVPFSALWCAQGPFIVSLFHAVYRLSIFNKPPIRHTLFHIGVLLARRFTPGVWVCGCVFSKILFSITLFLPGVEFCFPSEGRSPARKSHVFGIPFFSSSVM